MMNFLGYFIALCMVWVLGYVLWQSTMIIEEKKERQRKGLTDYYDNPIKKGKS